MTALNLTITAIISVNNDEEVIAAFLASVVPFVDQVIIEDLGSTDRTLEIAREHEVHVCDSDPGPRVACDWAVRLSPQDQLHERDIQKSREILERLPLDANTASVSVERSHLANSAELIYERNQVAAPCIDVIVLSYAKEQSEYDITKQCLASLRDSEPRDIFNVVVVETSTPESLAKFSETSPFEAECQVVHPQKPFHYNEFLQAGYRQLENSSAESLLILNNDVILEPLFASHLLAGLEQFDSVSPWCPRHHQRLFDSNQPYHPGNRTLWELCGWAIMFRKELLQKIPFDELFPNDFSFWYQDYYYGYQLGRIGARHALVTAAKALHLCSQSHRLIDPHRKVAMTRGARKIYNRKVAEHKKTDGGSSIDRYPVDS